MARAKTEDLLGEPDNSVVSEAADGRELTKGDNQGPSIEGGHILSYIERLEHLEEEKKVVVEEARDVLAEAKGSGYDVKVIRRLVKVRQMDREKMREEDEIFEIYCAAIGLVL